MTLDEIFQNVHELSTTKKFVADPVRQLAYLSEELGEVCREVLILTTKKSLEDPPDLEEVKKRLTIEAFDVIWNVCSVLRSSGITPAELEAAAQEKMSENMAREFFRD